MLSNLETLFALSTHGTMSKAAISLHITQSAVSKRIQNLELELGYRLIEKVGRKVELTAQAICLVERIRPLLRQLKDELSSHYSETQGKLNLAVSVSVLLSGGAKSLAEIKPIAPELNLTLQALHATLAVEKVRSGEVMLALVQGKADLARDLHSMLVTEQTMVLIPSGLKKFKLKKNDLIPILGMGDYAEAWKLTQERLRVNQPIWGFRFERVSELDSFSAIVEVARAGFGHGVAPLGVARALGVPENQIIHFPKPGVKIPVSIIGRKSTISKPLVEKFYQALKKSFANNSN